MRCLRIAWLGFCAAGLVCVPAHAERHSDGSSNQEWDGGYEQRAERRSGFVGSLGAGLGLATAAGYPNSVAKIDDPNFESSTDLGLGSISSIWIGGALRDWFTFGLGVLAVGAGSEDVKASGSGFILHVEAFPLWSLGQSLRDLSLYANLGAGALSIEGGPEKADGGLMSVINVGASFELLRYGHFALGPTLDGAYLYSRSAEALGAFVGVRTSFYGGP